MIILPNMTLRGWLISLLLYESILVLTLEKNLTWSSSRTIRWSTFVGTFRTWVSQMDISKNRPSSATPHTDNDSRRCAASDLVRGLLEQFAKEVTELFTQNVGQYLAEYEKDPVRNWKSKDTALYLITSLSARSSTTQVRIVT
jgi:hypothetical protein